MIQMEYFKRADDPAVGVLGCLDFRIGQFVAAGGIIGPLVWYRGCRETGYLLGVETATGIVAVRSK